MCASRRSKFHYNAGGLRDGILLEHGFACEVLLGLMASLLYLASLGAHPVCLCSPRLVPATAPPSSQTALPLNTASVFSA